MFRHLAACGLALLLPAISLAQLPLATHGITDRTTYTDAASFSVPVAAGHSYTVRLNGVRVPAELTNVVKKVDYHEVSVWRTNMASGVVTNRTVRFVVQASSRGSPERGLTVWTPYPPIPSAASEFSGAQLHLVAPTSYPAGLDIPVAAWIEDGNDRIVRGNGWLSAPGFEASAFRIVRGHGSGFIPAGATPGVIDFNAELTSLAASKQIQIESDTLWTTTAGVIGVDTVWPANSRIALTGHLTIPAGITLTVGAGSILKINPLVNITNSGSLILNGTLDQPVVLTPTTRPAPERNTGAWGGLIMRGGRLIANGAILTGGGGATSFSFSPGASHRSEQALLLIHSGSSAFLTNCFLLNQAGQIMNGYNSQIVFDHCLLQRAITTGESVGSTILINHSAVFEFPSIDGTYSAAIADSDYDGLYFTSGAHTIKDTLIGFAKDDAIDSGSGGAGTVVVTHCWIESALHEALAWSGLGRQTRTYGTVLMNSGQGIEAGFTDGTADRSPDCFADRLLSTGNSVGARFGDNYDWSYYGFLRITNSLLFHNYRDVFARTWNTGGSSWDTNQWIDRLTQMDLRGNYFTAADARFPGNSVWNPAADALRLAPFMTTPTNAAVGVGFAVWTNQFAMADIFAGIPVRLSSFTARPVSVECRFAGPAGALASQTVLFQPGETLKRAFPRGFDIQGQTPVHVSLVAPQGAEVTGVGEIQFTGAVPAPVISLAVTSVQMDLNRLGEGVPVSLSVPAAHTITVPYRYLAPNDHPLGSGTVTFEPGETLTWVTPPTIASGHYDIVRFEILNSTGASTRGPTTLFFVASEAEHQADPVTLIAYGARWKYLDDGSNQGTAWRAASFPDAAWPAGPAQLGFGDQDENTPISRTSRITGTTNITFYFRSGFVLTNVSGFTNLTMSLLRDDGGVVYLNGNEVFRSPNMPLGTISFNTFANDTGENSVDTAILSAASLVAGTNIVAVEIHQRDLGSSDISFDFELIGNPIPAAPTPQAIRAGLFAGQLAMAWGDRTYFLEQANTVTGAWTRLNYPSPVTIPATNNHLFYRLGR